MKKIGEQAKEFRLSKGWNSTRMAKEVGTSRQNIESLEDHPDRIPKYLGKLAVAMGVTVDDLMHGKYNAPTAPSNRAEFLKHSAITTGDLIFNPPPPPDIRFSMAPDEGEQESKDTELPAEQDAKLPIETLMAGLSAYLMKMDHDARDDAGDVLRKLAAKPENHARAAAMFAAAFQQRRRKVA